MEYDSRTRMPKLVRILLAYRGMTQGHLAERARINPKRLSERMRGQYAFTLEEAARMAVVLGVSPAVWFDEPEAVLGHLEAAREGEVIPRYLTEFASSDGDRPLPATTERASSRIRKDDATSNHSSLAA